jgi:DNA-binding MarR family transcriptional regulator
MPALLRHARLAYSAAMRTELDAAGYDDIPKNGLYVIGGLARETGAHPLSELIEELRLSKQAAGQLVDTLVTRGYLKRDVDSEDRRRLTIGLTARGRAAAKVLSAARARIDAALLLRIGSKDLETARRALFVLVDIGRRMTEQEGKGNSVTEGKGTMEIVNSHEAVLVRNSDLAQSSFDDVKMQGSTFININLGNASFMDVNLSNVSIKNANLTGMKISDAKAPLFCFDDVNMQGSTFTNINLGNATFKDVDLNNVSIKESNLTGMKINDVLVSELIRVYEEQSK